MTDQRIRLLLIVGLVVLLILDARVHYHNARQRRRSD